MATYRTEETEAKYMESLKNADPSDPCPLCAKPALKTFRLWKLVENSFPYDRIAATHHMIVPIRHAWEREVTQEEWLEYAELKKGFMNDDYDAMMERTHRTKTVPGHFHVHLLVIK